MPEMMRRYRMITLRLFGQHEHRVDHNSSVSFGCSSENWNRKLQVNATRCLIFRKERKGKEKKNTPRSRSSNLLHRVRSLFISWQSLGLSKTSSTFCKNRRFGSLLSCFPITIFYAFLISAPQACYMPCLCQLAWLDHYWDGVKIY